MKKQNRILSLTLAGLLSLSLLVGLSGCGSDPAPAPAEEDTVTTTTPPEEAPALSPIPAEQIADGTYEITVESSSSMFRVVHCALTVEGDTMTATMTMSGQGYGYVFPGTGEEALQASEDTYIPFVPDAEGAKTFALPIEALNQETDCAAWSIRKEKWYDRVLVFSSEGLPPEALTGEAA